MNKLLTTTLLFLLGTALVSCAGVTKTDVVSGDSESLVIRVTEWAEAYILADDHCAKYGKYSSKGETVTSILKTAYFSCFTAEQLLIMRGVIGTEVEPKVVEDNFFRRTYGSTAHPLTNLMRQANNIVILIQCMGHIGTVNPLRPLP